MYTGIQTVTTFVQASATWIFSRRDETHPLALLKLQDETLQNRVRETVQIPGMDSLTAPSSVLYTCHYAQSLYLSTCIVYALPHRFFTFFECSMFHIGFSRVIWETGFVVLDRSCNKFIVYCAENMEHLFRNFAHLLHVQWICTLQMS